MSEVAPRSFRESWESAPRVAKRLLILSLVLVAFAIGMSLVFPGARGGAFRNLAVALMLLLNQVAIVFLTSAQQKRVVIPQVVFILVMIVYMFAPLIGVVHQSSGNLPWDLLLVSFVPVLLFVLMARRTNTR